MKLILPQLNKTLEGTPEETLFHILRRHDIPVASSCLGDGICGKCRVTVIGDMKGLSAPTQLEQKLIAKYQLSAEQRISCQCRGLADISLRTTYW